MVQRDWNEWLEEALVAGNIAEAQEALAHGADPNLRVWEGSQTVLFSATARGSIEQVQLLLAAGATPAAEVGDESTSLHEAAASGDLKLLELLLQADGRLALGAFDYLERTPLMCAVGAGHLEAARILIQAGSDVNARHDARIGETALHVAVRQGNAEMVKLLLGAGADPSVPGWMMLTPLHLAEGRKSPTGQRILEMLQSPASLRAKPQSNRKRRRARSGSDPV